MMFLAMKRLGVGLFLPSMRLFAGWLDRHPPAVRELHLGEAIHVLILRTRLAKAAV